MYCKSYKVTEKQKFPVDIVLPENYFGEHLLCTICILQLFNIMITSGSTIEIFTIFLYLYMNDLLYISMVKTNIEIKGHLAEYLNGKYFNHEEDCVCLPDSLDLYHAIWDFMIKRPKDCQVDPPGNVSLGLPDRRVGKDPATYNYLGERSVSFIEKRVETMFFAELRSELDINKQQYGINYLDTVYWFINKYKIESITADALIKDFYRWREVIRRRKVRRNYNKKA